MNERRWVDECRRLEANLAASVEATRRAEIRIAELEVQLADRDRIISDMLGDLAS